VIVLDPGHGGIDPGTENKRVGVNEKTFTLDVALRAKKILELSGLARAAGPLG
jgi:N-acetylmuramoyl-L-alanine amidase